MWYIRDFEGKRDGEEEGERGQHQLHVHYYQLQTLN